MEKFTSFNLRRVFTIFIFIVCASLFAGYGEAYAEYTATIVDVKGSKVELTRLVTSAITLRIGNSEQVIPLKSIKEMNMKKHGGTFVVKLVSGEEITGYSDSTVQGTWELGEYKISLSQVKSLIIGGAAEALAWKKPEGYSAEVVDTKGSIMEVFGLSFEYNYSYTRSNCIGWCSASSDTTLTVLPLNQECGATLLPLTNITSISDISDHRANITFVDGKVTKSKFGYFGDENIDNVTGQTVLGNYTLSLDKTAKIVFHHEKDIPPLSKYEYGESKSNLGANIVCRIGNPISLVKVWIYELRSNGTPRDNNPTSVIKIKVGEAENNIDLSKISKIIINEEKDNNPILLTTKSGNTITADLIDDNYLGGYTKDGWFFYVKLKDLKEISLTTH